MKDFFNLLGWIGKPLGSISSWIYWKCLPRAIFGWNFCFCCKCGHIGIGCHRRDFSIMVFSHYYDLSSHFPRSSHFAPQISIFQGTISFLTFRMNNVFMTKYLLIFSIILERRMNLKTMRDQILFPKNEKKSLMLMKIMLTSSKWWRKSKSG